MPVGRFDAATGWTDAGTLEPVERDELTLSTFNVWYESYHAEERYQAIADLLSLRAPDIMVFQEVTPAALSVFLAQQWIRERYLRAEVTGDDVGNYGMLILSRLPIAHVTYTRLPSRGSRGFLAAEVMVNGNRQVVGCIHLDSGQSSSRRRGRQLRRILRMVGHAENAVLLGDFNMRDDENGRIVAPYQDVWPALHPGGGFTEDTTVNLMLWAKKNKPRQVRFDRVLVKGPQWAPADIELLGTEPISPAQPRVFPSDHFGVGCRLSRN